MAVIIAISKKGKLFYIKELAFYFNEQRKF